MAKLWSIHTIVHFLSKLRTSHVQHEGIVHFMHMCLENKVTTRLKRRLETRDKDVPFFTLLILFILKLKFLFGPKVILSYQMIYLQWGKLCGTNVHNNPHRIQIFKWMHNHDALYSLLDELNKKWWCTAQLKIHKHPAGTSVNSVSYAPCSKFYLLHYNVSQWEFQISHCFNSTIILIQNILLWKHAH